MIFQDRIEESAKVIKQFVEKFQVEIIAIGNGKGFRDVEKLVGAPSKAYNLPVKYTVVPETGASVYSASDIAQEEFLDLDLTVRGAISIGRQLQDPISELVKIEPRSLGVGQYQHDVEQNRLSRKLDKVVEDCVNQVGVNLVSNKICQPSFRSSSTGRHCRGDGDRSGSAAGTGFPFHQKGSGNEKG